MLKTVGLVASAIGLVMLLLAGWLLQRQLSFQSRASIAQGHVMDISRLPTKVAM